MKTVNIEVHVEGMPQVMRLNEVEPFRAKQFVFQWLLALNVSMMLKDVKLPIDSDEVFITAYKNNSAIQVQIIYV